MKELSIEEKKLLFEDLCARLPYGVYVEHITTEIRGKLKGIVFEHIYNNTDSIQDINAWVKFFGDEYVDATYFRPILRPMSSMTEEEKEEIALIRDRDFQSVRKWIHDESIKETGNICPITFGEIDYCNKKHLDYRGLIPMGLALEASKEMY